MGMNPVIIEGGGAVRSDQSIYEVRTTPAHALGTKGVIGQRVYYYAKSSGAAITGGALCRVAAGEAEHRSLSCESAAAGATQMTVTLGTVAVTVNQYAGGTVTIIDGTGQNQQRMIKSHPAAALSSTLVLTLEDGLELALAAADEATLRKNKFADIVVTPGDAIVALAGAPQRAIPSGATDPQYFWVQTWGGGIGIRNGDTQPTAEGSQMTYVASTTADAGELHLIATASIASTAAAGTPALFLRQLVATVRDPGDASDHDAYFVDWVLSQ